MVKKEEKLIISEEVIPGFRKGMNKKKLISGLTKEDWVFLDNVKKAEDMKVNELAYKYFVRSDQAYQEFRKIKNTISNAIIDVLVLAYEINKNKVDISLGSTQQKDVEGKLLDLDMLQLVVYKKEVQADQLLAVINPNLSRLYSFVGKMGFDRKVYFTKEEYDDYVQDIVRKLEKTPFSIE